jgi:hypothetical protein
MNWWPVDERPADRRLAELFRRSGGSTPRFLAVFEWFVDAARERRSVTRKETSSVD